MEDERQREVEIIKQHNVLTRVDIIIKVLLVDDSVVDRKIGEKILKKSGAVVVTANCVQEAMELLDSHGEKKFDLILSDFTMPELTGHDLLKHVKNSPHLKEIPVIIASSEDIAERINACIVDGAQEFLLKPIKFEDVSRICKKIWEKKNKN